MFNFSLTIKHGEKIIAYEEGITGGALKVNDAYNISLIQMHNGHYELRLIYETSIFL